MNERTDIEQKVINVMRQMGHEVIKNTLHRRRGWPDITVYVDNGLCIFWEFKVPGNKLSVTQLKTKDQLELKGHTVFVAYSKEEALEQYTKWIDDLQHEEDEVVFPSG